MTQVSLPITSRVATDPNNFANVVGNDNAILAVLNSDIRNDNIAAAGLANIATAKLANGTAGQLLIANASGAITATTLVNAAMSGTGALTGVNKDALDSSTVADIAGISSTATVRRGATNIAATESRTNTAYGTLTTPDQVANVVLPTNGLIAVAYQATWQQSITNAAKAAIFIGASQVVAANSTGTNVSVQEAGPLSGAAADGVLHSFQMGLTLTSFGGYPGDSTAGQVIGDSGAAQGGPCYIFVTAGTYTVSIQFKASSGSVTAKNRKLWVWTVGF